jgi:GTP-binding protein EngB required for normal cell division
VSALESTLSNNNNNKERKIIVHVGARALIHVENAAYSCVGAMKTSCAHRVTAQSSAAAITALPLRCSRTSCSTSSTSSFGMRGDDALPYVARTFTTTTPAVGTGAVLRRTRLLLQLSSRHRIVIPPLATLGGAYTERSRNSYASSQASAVAAASASGAASEYAQNSRLSPEVAQFIPPESAAVVQRAHQIDVFRESNDAMARQIWQDSKSHLRKQQKLVEEFGVEGAVRETLQPSTTSFRERLRQRPLDRAILQEIYLGLHGRRIERKLKRGVSWEHWITKGDGTAPVFNTSDKAQQTFAFGGDIKQVRCATHPQQFPVVLSHSSQGENAAAGVTATTLRKRTRAHITAKTARTTHPRSRSFVAREDLLPEVAVIGRTSSGKSSLVNSIVNATITPYGHLRGTTSAVRFYNIANRLMLVDCPGYGHYDPIATPAVDAENAVKAMRAYLACGAAPGAIERRRGRASASGRADDSISDGAEGSVVIGDEGFDNDDAASSSSSPSPRPQHGKGRRQASLLYQPRNLRRVLVCVSSHGMQHLDYAYCDLLETYQIPFSVVFTKTDAAPIRFLARLTDYTRSQLVRYTQCKEILLTSSLRIAGIDKVQELLGSFAAADDPLHGATTDFSAIV